MASSPAERSSDLACSTQEHAAQGWKAWHTILGTILHFLPRNILAAHLQASAALREVRVTVDPVHAVHVHRKPAAAAACRAQQPSMQAGKGVTGEAHYSTWEHLMSLLLPSPSAQHEPLLKPAWSRQDPRHRQRPPAEAAVVLGHGKANLPCHVHPMLAGTCLYEGPVEKIAVVCHIKCRLGLQDMSSGWADYEGREPSGSWWTESHQATS